MEAQEAKGLSISPIWSVRLHFIKLDIRATYALLKAEGLFAGSEAAFLADFTPATKAAFNLSKLVTAASGLEFSGLLETDGVALCVHFRRDKTAAEVAADEQREQGGPRASLRPRTAMRRARAAPSGSSASAPRRRRRSRRAGKRGGRRRPQLAATPRSVETTSRTNDPNPEDPPQQYVAPVLADGTLAHDPGNNPNVTYTVHIVAGKKVRRRFTIGRYYKDSGVKALQRHTAERLKGVQAEQATLDEATLDGQPGRSATTACGSTPAALGSCAPLEGALDTYGTIRRRNVRLDAGWRSAKLASTFRRRIVPPSPYGRVKPAADPRKVRCDAVSSERTEK